MAQPFTRDDQLGTSLLTREQLEKNGAREVGTTSPRQFEYWRAQDVRGLEYRSVIL